MKLELREQCERLESSARELEDPMAGKLQDLQEQIPLQQLQLQKQLPVAKLIKQSYQVSWRRELDYPLFGKESSSVDSGTRVSMEQDDNFLLLAAERQQRQIQSATVNKPCTLAFGSAFNTRDVPTISTREAEPSSPAKDALPMVIRRQKGTREESLHEKKGELFNAKRREVNQSEIKDALYKIHAFKENIVSNKKPVSPVLTAQRPYSQLDILQSPAPPPPPPPFAGLPPLPSASLSVLPPPLPPPLPPAPPGMPIRQAGFKIGQATPLSVPLAKHVSSSAPTPPSAVPPTLSTKGKMVGFCAASYDSPNKDMSFDLMLIESSKKKEKKRCFVPYANIYDPSIEDEHSNASKNSHWEAEIYEEHTVPLLDDGKEGSSLSLVIYE